MDAMNMIFENYGSERITRIFKSYWLLLLLIKQTMLSLFMIESSTAPVPVNDTEIIKKEVPAAASQDGGESPLNILRVIVTLTQPDQKNILKTENSTEKPNSPIHLDETI